MVIDAIQQRTHISRPEVMVMLSIVKLNARDRVYFEFERW